MIRKFQLEEACPFYHLGKFLNLAHFKDATDRHSDLYNDNVLRKNLYNIIARDVNAYCEEHNVVSMIRPGDNIEIKTSLLSVYDDIPGCAAAACSLAEQPPERLRFVPPREICT